MLNKSHLGLRVNIQFVEDGIYSGSGKSLNNLFIFSADSSISKRSRLLSLLDINQIFFYRFEVLFFQSFFRD